MRVKIFIIEDMCKDATTMLDLLKQSAAKIGNEENKFYSKLINLYFIEKLIYNTSRNIKKDR